MSGSDLFEEDWEREVAEALGDSNIEELEDLTIGAETGRDTSGTVREGRVQQVSGDMVLVDLGGKSPGMLPIGEFGKDRKSVPNPGAIVKVVIERFDEREGLFILSKRKAEVEAAWAALEPGATVEGVVTGMNKGGLEVEVRGIRAFMPASQVDIGHVHDISVFLQQTIQAEVTQVDRRDNNVVLSRRKLLEREKAATREQTLSELAEGEVREGVVRNITEYGAFVDIGGVDGLLHISDMSWGRVKDASEVVEMGQRLQVKVLKIDRNKERISLGLKQVMANPWDGVEQRYKPSQRITGRVTRLADFGAFVEVEPGLEGLVPIGEMSWVKRVRHPSEIISEGSVIEVEVLQVDPEKRRMSLGMRQIQDNPWDGVASRYRPESVVKGKVTRLADFGAFVEVEPGIEGLVHISELADRRVNRVSEVVGQDQEVQVRVLSVDPDNQRMSLSLKGVSTSAEAVFQAEEADKEEKRKRKRPRRGGLETGNDGWLSLS
ncbi:MAG: S1 RNA-binding domain-containing protein [Phycisphaerae bacterium]|nr:S1 RNA-binding domain-containing protein [Phycisphaerae bacterium]